MCCPICEKELKEKYLDYYNGIIHEYLYFCESDDHEFSEEYAFGSTTTKIGNKVLNHHHSYNDAENNKYNEEYDFYVWMEKKRLKESKKEDE